MDQYPLKHFIDLARQGRSGAASGGEQRAHRLALSALENCCGLDHEAVRGLGMFLIVCNADPQYANTLIYGSRTT